MARAGPRPGPRGKASSRPAYLDALEKDGYPTRIIIERSGGNEPDRNPASVQKEWSGAFRYR